MNRGKHVLLSALACAVLSVTWIGSSCGYAQDAPRYSKQQLQNLYMDFLKREGYVPSVDRDGDVMFKVEGLTYFVLVDENDPQFFRLVFPNFWPLETLEEQQKALLAAHHSTKETKVSKVYLVEGNVWASIEIFVKTPEDFEGVFARCLSALKSGTDTFASKMRE